MSDQQRGPTLVAGVDLEEQKARLRFLHDEGLAMLAAYRELALDQRHLILKLVQSMAAEKISRSVR